MLFNSLPFIFGFLPFTLLAFYLTARFSHRAAAAFLVLASLYFYAEWHFRSLYLLLASIAVNYAFGKAIAMSGDRDQRRRRTLLVAGVAANLACLTYFKYWNFLLESFHIPLPGHVLARHITLPLGISFFTFTQIAYLVDVYRRKAREGNATHYALFVSYFPHLIAGPIIHHSEVMPQFGRASTYKFSADNLAVGLTIFVIGLFKKVVLADGVAPYVHAVFDGAAGGAIMSSGDAWFGAVAYAMQIYFDFSGYSDMAIGLSRMFGVRLPLNFNSPYKATDVIDFWRRWHMTLSRFLRDYLYIPLGGNRLGRSRQLVNVMIVMLLGGLWHGAGWTFVVWGGLHGIFLVSNHVWRMARGAPEGLPAWRRAISCAVTFLFVTIAWVFFRAADMPTAFSMVKSMMGAGAPAAATLADLPGLAKIAALLVIVWSFPNTQEFMGRVEPALGYDPAQRPRVMAAWQPNWLTASMSASLAVWALGTMLYSSRIAEFIYFQF